MTQEPFFFILVPSFKIHLATVAFIKPMKEKKNVVGKRNHTEQVVIDQTWKCCISLVFKFGLLEICLPTRDMGVQQSSTILGFRAPSHLGVA